MNKQLCPEIHYRREGEKLILTGCYGIDGNIYIPDELDGQPIIGIGAYAFAEGRDEGEEVWLSPEAQYIQERHRICAEEVKEIRLPGQITEIGRYAFYRCKELHKLVLSDSLPDIGGGALNGCHPKEVEIHFHRGEKSALKCILDEVRFTVRVVMYHYIDDKSVRESRVLFPEHYEEAVENTPARLLETRQHGSGNYYRQCFYNRELDYKKYDEVFPYAAAQEDGDTVAELVMCRLMYPYKLSGHAKAVYLKYLECNICQAACFAVERDNPSVLRFLTAEKYMTGNALDRALEKAAELGRTDITGILMDERQKHFAGRKKKFDL